MALLDLLLLFLEVCYYERFSMIEFFECGGQVLLWLGSDTAPSLDHSTAWIKRIDMPSASSSKSR